MKKVVDEQLLLIVEQMNAPTRLKEAMRYSLEAGGKRIRPLLLFATMKALGKSLESGIPVACAIEMIHTYSLIHDDLPCMDDDDLRRGKPTNHKVFGEAMAVLAGDGLLTNSFQVISDSKDITDTKKIKLLSELAKSAGSEGMVGGQVADMEGEGKHISLAELEYIHEHKTGKMLEYSIIAGAILADADSKKIENLRKFAYHLGLAFQIRDDLLDIEGTEAEIGKRVGSDVLNEKVTYPSLLSLEGAKEKLSVHMKKAKEILHETLGEAEELVLLCDLIGARKS